MFVCVARLNLAIPESGSLKAKRQVLEQMDTIIHSVEEMYVAPLISRETEIVSLGDQFYPDEPESGVLSVPKGHRSLAEAEGLGDWEQRYARSSGKSSTPTRRTKKLSLEEARAKARGLRNPRDWEKE